MIAPFRRCGSALLALLLGTSLLIADNAVADETPAKALFGAKALPAEMAANPYGFYAKGCLAGGVAIPTDGPTAPDVQTLATRAPMKTPGQKPRPRSRSAAIEIPVAGQTGVALGWT